MKNLLLLSIFIISSLFGFSRNATLKGKVINNNKYVKIELQNLNNKVIETQELAEDGSFKFNTTFNKFNFYVLVLDKQNFVVFFPEPGEQTEITIDVKNIRNPQIKNSKQSKLYYEYASKIANAKKAEEKANVVKQMIDENPSSPVCVFFVDILDNKKDYAYYKKLSDGLKPYSDNQLVHDFIQKTKNIKKLEIGNEAPEIALKNPEGKVVKLSSLRGKYVLIDFWASWCRPCRMENPNNVKMYQKYQDKGFEIYGVSLDRDKNSWLKAIKDDNLTWTQVSDLKFWNSEGAKIYNVRSIPHTVLLDKEGKIIAKNLRGKSLEKKLAEIFEE